MKKLFISQPMNDKTDEEILSVRTKIIDEVKNIINEDIEVIESFFQDSPHDAKPLWFLGKSLEFLADADYVYFAEGWENYRGCHIEHQCALAYGLNILRD